MMKETPKEERKHALIFWMTADEWQAILLGMALAGERFPAPFFQQAALEKAAKLQAAYQRKIQTEQEGGK